MRPILCNSDELSKAAFRSRVQSGIGTAQNVAVARVPGWNDARTGDLVVGCSKGSGYHSEDDILVQLANRGFDASRITGLYSDRQPCPVCRSLLDDQLSKGTPVSQAVLWGNSGTVNEGATDLLAVMIQRAKRST